MSSSIQLPFGQIYKEMVTVRDITKNTAYMKTLCFAYIVCNIDIMTV